MASHSIPAGIFTSGLPAGAPPTGTITLNSAQFAPIASFVSVMSGGVAMRYDRRTVHFTGFVHLAAAMIRLR